MFKRLFAVRPRAAILACAAAVGAFSFVSASSAATVTRTIQFEASDFVLLGDGPVVLPSVTGQVTLSFDPIAAVTDQTAGITLDSLSIPLGSPISFSNQPVPNPLVTENFLILGGAAGGISGLSGADFTLDFFAINASSLAIPGGFFEYRTESGVIYNATHFNASFVTVPEPSSWALMIGGVALLGGALRVSRRRALATA